MISRHNLNSLFYSDDTQLYIAINPGNQAPSLTTLQTCIEDVMRWNTQNTLRSNAEKTEVILFTSRFTKTSNIEKLFFDSTVIELTEKVRDLGVILHKNLTPTYHINETYRKATNAIRSIGRIRKYLANKNLKLLVNALVYHDWTTVTVSFMVFQNGNWTNFKEFKTLQLVLLLELNNTITLNLLFRNYTVCQLNHV